MRQIIGYLLIGSGASLLLVYIISAIIAIRDAHKKHDNTIGTAFTAIILIIINYAIFTLAGWIIMKLVQ